jgi:starvation-inducible outer membrane lipoprotein
MMSLLATRSSIHQILCLSFLAIALVCSGCGAAPNRSAVHQAGVQQPAALPSGEEVQSTTTEPDGNEDRWGGAATAVLFVFVVLGSAALPLLLLL